VAKKRAVGEGSIYRRKDGRWEVAIRAATSAGIRKRIRKYAKTRAEADEILTNLKQQVHQGVPLPDRTWKLGPYLDYWPTQPEARTRRLPATAAHRASRPGLCKSATGRRPSLASQGSGHAHGAQRRADERHA
jgi:hypothetical protein